MGLLFTGKHSIFTRYLSDAVVHEGKGSIVTHTEYLPMFDHDVRDEIDHAGIAVVKSGYYRSNQPGSGQLFVNLGSGAVLYEGLPFNDGRVFVDYYGDTVGLRNLDITPEKIKLDLIADLNEAFKMLKKFIQEA